MHFLIFLSQKIQKKIGEEANSAMVAAGSTTYAVQSMAADCKLLPEMVSLENGSYVRPYMDGPRYKEQHV